MELRHINYFLTVAKEGGFRRAAERLNLSQPPLSRQIMALEEELGVRLIDRGNRSFALTDSGRFFRDGAERILDELAVLARRTRLAGTGKALPLCIASVGSLLYTFVPDLIAFLRQRHPDLRIELLELSTDEQIAAIREGRIDLGFLRSWVPGAEVEFEALGEEELCLVCHEGMADQASEPPDLSGFAELPFISGTAPGFSERVAETCARAGFSPRVHLECAQFTSILKLVSAGLGWSILPRPALGGIAVERVRFIGLPDRVRFGMAYARGTVTAGAAAVMESVRLFAQGGAPEA